MEWYEALAVLLGSILVLMAIGMPVALAFLAANIIGAWLFMGGERGITQLLNNGLGSLTKYALVPIPLFLLMGEIFFHTGLGGRMFNAIDQLLGKLPGRLSYVTVIGGTAFSTLSGSSMGSTALLGSLMVPEMNRRGYKKYMSIGPILGTGGLAIIIPPSALAVLLATLAQIDVAALLIAGVIPGLVLALFYIGMIALQVRLDPSAAPAYDVLPLTWSARLKLLMSDVVPMVGVMVLIVVLMINGIVTPSEAAAFGALGVLVLAIVYRCLTLDAVKRSITGALRVTLMAYLIVFGSATFSQLLAFSGASRGLITWATGFDLDPLAMLLVMFAVLLLLGMVMEHDFHDVADGSHLLSTGTDSWLRSHLVWPDHASGAGDQLYDTTVWFAALCDERRLTTGYHHAGDIPGCHAIYRVFIGACCAADCLSTAGFMVAEFEVATGAIV